jgi:ATP-binding cassette subfamily C protein
VRTILKIFFKSESNAWRVLLALLFANIAEGLGWASLVPLFSIVAPDPTGGLSQMTQYTQDVLGSVGLSMSIEVLLAFFVFTMVSKALLRFWAMSYVGTAVAYLSTRLRSQLIRNIFNVRWSYLVDHPLGVFTNAISSQAQMASAAFRVTAIFIAQLLQSITYLTVAFFISWPLALATIALGIIMLLALNLLVRLARKSGIRETKRNRKLVVFLTDTLINIKPLRAMMRQHSFSNLLEKIRRATAGYSCPVYQW